MEVTRIAQDVQVWMATQGVVTGSDLTAVEATVAPLMQQIGAKVVEVVLGGQKLGYTGSSRPCACGERQRFVSHRTKAVLTTMGVVQLERAYYHCPACGEASIPHDEQAGLDAGGLSVALAQRAAMLGVHVPFGLASQMLEHLTAQRVPDRTIERLVPRVGAVAVAQEAQHAEQMATWNAPPADLLPDTERPKTVYVAVDGAMVRQLEAWREVKTAAV